MTYKKTSLGVVGMLLQTCSAVKLDSTLTPCAEQALAQIEAAVTANKHCLCFQYATVNLGSLNFVDVTADLVDTNPATARIVVAASSTPIASVTPLVVTGAVSGGGALISAIDGECVDQSYIVTQN